MRLQQRPVRVLLGVSGGIAAYKALELLRLFRKAGWDVTVVMTRAATRFVGAESFRALSGNPVAVELFPRRRPAAKAMRAGAGVEHVDLAAAADLVVVAPATANILGKLAAGVADDLLSTLLLAVPQANLEQGRVLLAPAMNVNMWNHPSLRRNVRQLRDYGYRFIAPSVGELACGTTGTGRLAEPAVIFDACRSALRLHRETGGLRSLRVLVTSGRTEEPLDPVRVITNRSSGRMGVEIASAFADSGASVKLIAGAVSVPLPTGIAVQRATTADRMLKAVLAALPTTDILVMCAAVGDYRPASPARAKRHGDELTLRLRRTPDVLLAVGSKLVASRRHPLVVGFSLDDSLGHARTKLRAKGLDIIVANPYATAGSDRIRAKLIFRTGRQRKFGPMPKPEFARALVETIAGLYHDRKAKR